MNTGESNIAKRLGKSLTNFVGISERVLLVLVPWRATIISFSVIHEKLFREAEFRSIFRPKFTSALGNSNCSFFATVEKKSRKFFPISVSFEITLPSIVR